MHMVWVVWLQMARKGSKWPKMVNFQKYLNSCGVGSLAPNGPYRLKNGPKGQKWLKMVNFQKYSHVCGVGTLNLSQEMSDKMQNESGQFFYTEQRKRQKYGQN